MIATAKMPVDAPLVEQPRRLRVVVIGNSNSILRWSYVRLLEKLPDLEVRNRSIGGSPNVLLLDYIAREQDWDYDFVIVENAVVDFLHSKKRIYTEERSREALELFVRFVRARTNAEIIILTIPTREDLLAPGHYWQESLYKNAADRLGLPILDGFRLLRTLVGRPKFALVQYLTARALRQVQAFGLDANVTNLIAWRSMRDKQVATNALGLCSFWDDAHLSPPTNALISDLLAQYMALRGPPAAARLSAERADVPSVAIASSPQGGTKVSRTSSLMSRDMVRLTLGESARYACPPGYLAYGFMLNIGASRGFLRFESPAGTAVFDARYLPNAMTWIGVVTAILDPVGDGDIVVSIIDQPDSEELVRVLPDAIRSNPEAGTEPEQPFAEIGELVLVRRGWQDLLPAREAAGRPAFQIDTQPWAQGRIESTAFGVDQAVEAIELENHQVALHCFRVAQNMLANRSAPLTAADRARLMLLLGMTTGLADFVEDACRDDPANGELQRMRAALRQLAADDELKPRDLLDKAIALLQSGAVADAERAFADGMARFPDQIGFFIQHAWVPLNQKNLPEAIRRWQNVIECFPDHPASYLGMITSLELSGDRIGADKLLDFSVARFPADPHVAKRHLDREAEKIGNNTHA